MKLFIILAAAVCAFAIHAAPIATLLKAGENLVTPGQIVGIECVTVSPSQAVTASVVSAVTEWTNAYKSVTTKHTRYDFALTNYDGLAAISTNLLDRFAWEDFATNVSWIGSISTNTTPWTTNYVTRDSRVVDRRVTAVATNITESIPDGKRIKATYTKETAIGSGTASSHYLLITPASTMNLYGGRVKVSCGAGDNITIITR